MLADRIEELIIGNSSFLFPVSEQFDSVEKTAQIYAEKIMKEKLFSAKKQAISLTKEVETNCQNVDRGCRSRWLKSKQLQQNGKQRTRTL